jgi:methyltransferase (TIGR00027 family)
MDARAYRLFSLVGAKAWEIDRDFVFAYKREHLGGAQPKCPRVEIAMDLRDDWPSALRAAGFDPSERAIWLVEGLLVYLDEAAVRSILARVTDLAAPGSILMCDVIGRALLGSPFMTHTLDLVRELGAPWRFGTDDPASLLPAWEAEVDEFGEVGTAYGRWPFPLAPKGTPGVPMSYLVRATRLS